MMVGVRGVPPRREIERRPCVGDAGKRIGKTSGHDARDRVWLAAHNERPTDGAGIASQLFLPESMTEDADRGAVFVVRLKPATDLRVNAHDVEVLGAGRQQADASRPIAAADVGASLI